MGNGVYTLPPQKETGCMPEEMSYSSCTLFSRLSSSSRAIASSFCVTCKSFVFRTSSSWDCSYLSLLWSSSNLLMSSMKKQSGVAGRPGRGGDGWGLVYSYVSYLCYWIVDHASLRGQSWTGGGRGLISKNVPLLANPTRSVRLLGDTVSWWYR